MATEGALPFEPQPLPQRIFQQQARQQGRRRFMPVLPVSLVLALALAGWLLPSRLSWASDEERPAAAAGRALGSPIWIQPVTPPHAPGEDAGAAAVPRTPIRGAPSVRPVPEATAGATTPALRELAPNDGRAAMAVRPMNVLPRPQPEAPGPERARVLATPGIFRGTTYNETLGHGGRLQLAVTPVGSGDAVVVRFDASGGLIGAGQLTGRLSREGRLVASGTLMMGQNPFATDLQGTISGGQLVGNVRYTRIVEPGARPSSSRGTFRLSRD